MDRDSILKLVSKIKVAKVLEVKKNENSDHLFVTKVNDGSNDFQVVTGAQNVAEGQYVPFLGINETVPGFLIKDGEKLVLEKRVLRGYESQGMLLSGDEIGINDDHEGIFILEGLSDQDIGKSIVDVISGDILEPIFELGENNNLVNERFALITRDIEEIIGEQEIKDILKTRDLKIYWGTAPTGKPSIGYFLPMMKIADFLNAGSEVTILLANIHAYLDNMKTSWELLEHRSDFYKLLITEILNSLKVNTEKLKFIQGTDFQLEKDYTLDVYKIAVQTTVQSVKGAGAEVVKQVENPVLGGLLYPILQALDEEYLNVDIQLGGVDQRKIFMFSRENLPKLGYRKRSYLMNPLVPGLGKSGKMSSSEPNSKIDFDNSDEIITQKISKAYSVDGEVEGNGLLSLMRFIVFRMLDGRPFVVERDEKWGGDLEIETYDQLEDLFVSKKLSSADLKPAVAREIINIVAPIRTKLLENSELVKKAYPQ